MQVKKIEHQIQNLLVEILYLSDTPKRDDDLNLNSMAKVQVLMGLENAFDVEIDGDFPMEIFDNIQYAAAYIATLIQSSQT